MASTVTTADPLGSHRDHAHGESRRRGLLRDLEHPSDLFANLSPNWFASTWAPV